MAAASVAAMPITPEPPALPPSFRGPVGRDADAPPLRVRGPGAVPPLVPHLLGFEPERSIVLIGLGDGDVVRVTLRFDLPHDADEVLVEEAMDAYAQSFAAIRAAGAMRVLVLVMPEGPGAEWPLDYLLGLPHRVLAMTVRDRLQSLGIHVADVLCVVGDRFRSYVCDDPVCCPPDGRPARTEESARVEAELVAAGSAPLPSRDALVEALAPRLPGDPLLAAAERCRDGVLLRLPPSRRESVDHFVEQLARVTGRPSGETALARLAVTAQILVSDIRSRDYLLRCLTVGAGRPLQHAARAVLSEAVRCAADEAAAQPASSLAVVAWTTGDGAAARIAAERSLAADPECSLAALVLEALDRGLPPWTWPDIMASISAEEILGDDPPAQERSPA